MKEDEGNPAESTGPPQKLLPRPPDYGNSKAYSLSLGDPMSTEYPGAPVDGAVDYGWP